MRLSQGTFVNVSGIDTNEGVNIVFVWGRRDSSQDYELLGSGHVVGSIRGGRPPGISIGQYSVTVLLPAASSVADIFVTDDRSEERLAGVNVRPCTDISDAPPSGGVISGESIVRDKSSETYRDPAKF
jgi:hypothetical protein